MTASTTYLRAPRGLAGVIADGKRQPLSLDEIRYAAPSVFATAKHSSRSERFGFVGTDHILRGLVAEGFQPVSVRQGGTRVAGKAEFTKHILRFTHRAANQFARHGSVPEIILINSHDGTSAYRLLSGVWRAACDNGLVCAESVVADLRVPHTIRAVQDVVERSWEVVALTKEVMGIVDRWSHIRDLSPKNLLDFAEQAHLLRFPDRESQAAQKISPRNLLDIRRDEDAHLDLYTMFNVVQENCIRGGIEYRQERTRRVTRDNGAVVVSTTHVDARTRPINGIDDEVNLNRNLWDLAMQMERQLA